MPACEASDDERRRPKETARYRVVERHWPAFLERADERGGLPRFVVREVEEYLRCGRLEERCLKLECRECGESMVVELSCKRRGVLGKRSARRRAQQDFPLSKAQR